MKIVIILILVVTIAVFVLGCGRREDASNTTSATNTDAPETQATDAPLTRTTLRVLAIGNSYSQDTTYYLYDVAKAQGYETVYIGQMFIAGCPLDRHVKNAKEDLYEYKFYTNFDGQWQMKESYSLKAAIESQPWDVITIQQASSKSGLPGTYEPYMTELIQYVNEHKTNPDCRLAWHMTWAYQNTYESGSFENNYGKDQMVMYQSIVSTVQQRVVGHEGIDFIIPSGTAIQNARSGFVGDTLNRDGTHLSDYARAIAAYTWLAAIEGRALKSVDLAEIQTGILNDQYKHLIMESVNNALERPFEITESAIEN